MGAGGTSASPALARGTLHPAHRGAPSIAYARSPMIPIRAPVASRRSPVAVLLLVVVNAAFFALELTLPPDRLTHIVNRYGIVPVVWSRFAPQDYLHEPRLALAIAQSLIGSQFLHAG